MNPWRAALVVFPLALVLFAYLFLAMPVLYDTDSYYHLAVARTFAEHGPIDTLPWARLSLLFEGFGDKELLFHVLLTPFSGSSAGGRWALALWNALLAAILAALGTAAAGRWGALAPLFVYAGSLAYVSRAIRLRPELLALFLFLLAAWAAARGRYRLLGLITFLFTLGYTAFHALLGLAFLWFLLGAWRTAPGDRRWRWEALLYPILGAGLALVLHPHFPHNLVVWKVQSLDFFLAKGSLNVGREIRAATVPEMLRDNLGWLLALAALAWAGIGRPRKTPTQVDRRPPAAALADTLWVATGAFAVLYFLMLRFVTYLVPFATLAVLAELAARGALGVQASSSVHDRGRRWAPLLALAAVLFIGLPPTFEMLQGMSRGGGELSREEEWAAFGRAVPTGAKVAADWGPTHLYMYWAPQAAYLNVLDPVFMARPFPEAYGALQAILESREPDLPLALHQQLDSDHLALSRYHQPQELLLRLRDDPRIEPVYQGHTLLYALAEDHANRDFLLDWRVVPEGSTVPIQQDQALTSFTPYPRAEEARARRLEGFIDAGRVPHQSRCLALVHQESFPTATRVVYELASWGATNLWADTRLVAANGATPRAVVGSGLTLPIDWTAGEHRLTALTCPGDLAGDEKGFYLLRRRVLPLKGSG